MQHLKTKSACAEALIFLIFDASPPNEAGLGQPEVFKNATHLSPAKKNLRARPILPSLRDHTRENKHFFELRRAQPSKPS
jgi:hypothetical protein